MSQEIESKPQKHKWDNAWFFILKYRNAAVFTVFWSFIKTKFQLSHILRLQNRGTFWSERLEAWNYKFLHKATKKGWLKDTVWCHITIGDMMSHHEHITRHSDQPSNIFSCPQQLNRTHCPLLGLTKLTIRVFTTLQSDPRDLWPLRHLIREIFGRFSDF